MADFDTIAAGLRAWAAGSRKDEAAVYPVARESPAVIVSRNDLRAVTAGAIPADVRERFLEALGEGNDG